MDRPGKTPRQASETIRGKVVSRIHQAFDRKKFAEVQSKAIEIPINGLAKLARSKILDSLPEGTLENEYLEKEVFFEKIEKVRKQFLQHAVLYEHQQNPEQNILISLAKAKSGQETWNCLQELLVMGKDINLEIVDQRAQTARIEKEIIQKLINTHQEYDSQRLAIVDATIAETNTQRAAHHNERLLVSLLNQELSYWRRYCELNLRPESNKKQDITTLNGIIFDTCIVEPHVRYEKNRNDSLQFHRAVVESFLELSRYDAHTFQTEQDDDFFNESMKQNTDKVDTSYNRSRECRFYNGELIATERVVTKKSVLVSDSNPSSKKVCYYQERNLPSHPDHGYQSLARQPFRIGEVQRSGDMPTMREQVALHLLDSKGDVKKSIDTLTHAKVPMPESEVIKLIEDVAGTPWIIINPPEVKSANSAQELQAALTEIANRLKKEQPYIPFVIVVGTSKDGSLGMAMSRNHDIGDGGEANEMLEKLYVRLRGKLKTEQTTTFLTEKDVVIDEVKPPIDALSVEKGNEPIQAYVKATELFKLADGIANQVRKLAETYPDLKKTRLKSSSFVLQLIVAKAYRDIYAESKGDPLLSEEVGLLVGNKSLTKDLDLIPITAGFDITHYLRLTTDSERTAYILEVTEQTQKAQEDSSMNLIKKTSDHVPSHWMQEKLNWISKLPLTSLGLRLLTGELMMSGFPMPRDLTKMKPWITTSGPALTEQQDLALTLCASFKYKRTDSQKEELILSLRAKGRKNAVAHAFLVNLKAWIEEQQYLPLTSEKTDPKRMIFDSILPKRVD